MVMIDMMMVIPYGSELLMSDEEPRYERHESALSRSEIVQAKPSRIISIQASEK